MTESNVTDYRATWENAYRAAYAAGRKHWRPELATPPAFRRFCEGPRAPAAGARVLEAGCGDGLNAIYLTDRGYQVTGVDISEDAITRAREVASRIGAPTRFLYKDLVREPLGEDGSYDLWVDVKTLHCLWEDTARIQYLMAAALALRAPGILYLNCALALVEVRDYFPSVFAALAPSVREQAGYLDRELPPEKRSGIRCETLDWYCQELRQAGFRICEAEREASIEAGWGVIILAQKERAMHGT